MKNIAQHTSHQAAGSATIDLVWTLEKDVEKINNLMVWDDYPTIESDHSLVSIDIFMDSSEDQKETAPEKDSSAKGYQVRIVWQKKRTNPQAWKDLSQQLTIKVELGINYSKLMMVLISNVGGKNGGK